MVVIRHEVVQGNIHNTQHVRQIAGRHVTLRVEDMSTRINHCWVPSILFVFDSKTKDATRTRKATKEEEMEEGDGVRDDGFTPESDARVPAHGNFMGSGASNL